MAKHNDVNYNCVLPSNSINEYTNGNSPSASEETEVDYRNDRTEPEASTDNQRINTRRDSVIINQRNTTSNQKNDSNNANNSDTTSNFSTNHSHNSNNNPPTTTVKRSQTWQNVDEALSSLLWQPYDCRNYSIMDPVPSPVPSPVRCTLCQSNSMWSLTSSGTSSTYSSSDEFMEDPGQVIDAREIGNLTYVDSMGHLNDVASTAGFPSYSAAYPNDNPRRTRSTYSDCAERFDPINKYRNINGLHQLSLTAPLHSGYRNSTANYPHEEFRESRNCPSPSTFNSRPFSLSHDLRRDHNSNSTIASIPLAGSHSFTNSICGNVAAITSVSNVDTWYRNYYDTRDVGCARESNSAEFRSATVGKEINVVVDNNRSWDVFVASNDDIRQNYGTEPYETLMSSKSITLPCSSVVESRMTQSSERLKSSNGAILYDEHVHVSLRGSENAAINAGRRRSESGDGSTKWVCYTRDDEPSSNDYSKHYLRDEDLNLNGLNASNVVSHPASSLAQPQNAEPHDLRAIDQPKAMIWSRGAKIKSRVAVNNVNESSTDFHKQASSTSKCAAVEDVNVFRDATHNNKTNNNNNNKEVTTKKFRNRSNSDDCTVKHSLKRSVTLSDAYTPSGQFEKMHVNGTNDERITSVPTIKPNNTSNANTKCGAIVDARQGMAQERNERQNVQEQRLDIRNEDKKSNNKSNANHLDSDKSLIRQVNILGIPKLTPDKLKPKHLRSSSQILSGSTNVPDSIHLRHSSNIVDNRTGQSGNNVNNHNVAWSTQEQIFQNFQNQSNQNALRSLPNISSLNSISPRKCQTSPQKILHGHGADHEVSNGCVYSPSRVVNSVNTNCVISASSNIPNITTNTPPKNIQNPNYSTNVNGSGNLNHYQYQQPQHHPKQTQQHPQNVQSSPNQNQTIHSEHPRPIYVKSTQQDITNTTTRSTDNAVQIKTPISKSLVSLNKVSPVKAHPELCQVVHTKQPFDKLRIDATNKSPEKPAMTTTNVVVNNVNHVNNVTCYRAMPVNVVSNVPTIKCLNSECSMGLPVNASESDGSGTSNLSAGDSIPLNVSIVENVGAKKVIASDCPSTIPIPITYPNPVVVTSKVGIQSSKSNGVVHIKPIVVPSAGTNTLKAHVGVQEVHETQGTQETQPHNEAHIIQTQPQHDRVDTKIAVTSKPSTSSQISTTFLTPHQVGHSTNLSTSLPELSATKSVVNLIPSISNIPNITPQISKASATTPTSTSMQAQQQGPTNQGTSQGNFGTANMNLKTHQGGQITNLQVETTLSTPQTQTLQVTPLTSTSNIQSPSTPVAARVFTSTEVQTDDTLNPLPISNPVTAAPIRDVRRRERREQRRAQRRNVMSHPHMTALNHHPVPSWLNPDTRVSERLPDILNSHMPPPYSTLPSGNPPIPNMNPSLQAVQTVPVPPPPPHVYAGLMSGPPNGHHHHHPMGPPTGPYTQLPLITTSAPMPISMVPITTSPNGNGGLRYHFQNAVGIRRRRPGSKNADVIHKEQLGYIVFSGMRRSNGVQGVRIIVQSDKHPSFVDQRVEEFFSHITDILEEMSDEEFERYKEALAAQRLEKPKGLSVLTLRFWSEISSQQYNFDRANIEVNYLRTVTKENIKHFFKKYIERGSETRNKMAVYIVSNMDSADKQDVEKVELHYEQITDITVFKTTQAMFPLVQPYLNIPRKGNKSKL